MHFPLSKGHVPVSWQGDAGTWPCKNSSGANDSTYVLNGRVDELALYKRLLTASERAWLSRNNGQGRAYTDIPAPQLPPDVSLAYTYGDPAHAHAVTALGDNQYAYDPNGNQIERNIANDGQYQLLYDADIVPAGGNRVVEVKKDGAPLPNSPEFTLSLSKGRRYPFGAQAENG